jgi:hypothetical protein
MHHLILLAVSPQAGASILNTMPNLVGTLLIIIALTLVWGACVLTVFVVKYRSPTAAHHGTPTPAPAPAPATPRQTDSAIAPETIVVIAAAVNSTIGKDYKVISIKSQDTAWEMAGRHAVLTSHRIR